MDHLDGTSVEELRRALERVDGTRARRRLLAAIGYKNGVAQTELADRYGVSQRTIYNWLKRLEDGPPARRATDRDRSGRPRKLTGSQRATLERALRGAPGAAGVQVDAPAWTPAHVRRFLRARFDVDYSPSSCRRFMREAGLEYRRSQRRWVRSGSGDAEPHGCRGADGRGVDCGADGRGEEPRPDESRWPPAPSASGGNDRGSPTSASGSPQGT